MAKTKQDYQIAGYADAQAYKPRAAIAAATWQAKYYDLGYDEGTAAAELYAKSDYMPAPVMEHIHRLWRSLAGQASSNLKRATRVKVKIAHLEAKYAQRAARV